MTTHPFAVGDTFHHLTVEALVGRKSAMARCVCGGLVSVTASALLGGRLKSCGCQQYVDRAGPERRDLTGQRFGQWTVRHKLDTEPGAPTLWRVICSCGREGKVTIDKLTSGQSKRCRSCAGRASHRTRRRAQEKRDRRV